VASREVLAWSEKPSTRAQRRRAEVVGAARSSDRRYAYQVVLMEELVRHGVTVVFLHGPEGRTAETSSLSRSKV
jgi:hypothetical protein